MKRFHIMPIILSALMLFFCITQSRVFAEDSLFEYYTQASKESLSEETGEMGRQLRAAFSQASVKQRQRQIDFAEYFSNLKKAVSYAARLAAYSAYNTDLRFARDNEIFKGLPEEKQPAPGSGPPLDRKAFVHDKYGRMKKNIEEEIDTYKDLILLSLDSCETLTRSDLSGILTDPRHRDRIRKYMRQDAYRQYADRSRRLSDAWPELSQRIAAQFALWQPAPPSPDTPILNPQIIGAL